MIFCSSRPYNSIRRIRGRAVKALRSGRSQLCWRGFESHRMQHLFLLFGSTPDYSRSNSVGFVTCTHARLCSGGGQRPWIYTGHLTMCCRPMSEKRTHTTQSLGRVFLNPNQQKKTMAVPGFEPGSSGSQPLMLTTTLYHHGCDALGTLENKKQVDLWVVHRSKWTCSGTRVRITPAYNCFDSSVGRALD